jgi:hypothetical protein
MGIDSNNEHTKKYDKKREKAIKKAKKKKEKQEIKDIMTDYGPAKPEKRAIDLSTTTKQIMAFIVINCTVVELYAMVVMYKFQDLTTLDALVSAVVAETVSFMAYCLKSYFETKTEREHSLEVDKFNYECQSDASDEDIDDEVHDDES